MLQRRRKKRNKLEGKLSSERLRAVKMASKLRKLSQPKRKEKKVRKRSSMRRLRRSESRKSSTICAPTGASKSSASTLFTLKALSSYTMSSRSCSWKLQ